MLEPPDLSNDRIVASVRTHYGVQLTALAFLPLGQDVMAWTYRAATAGTTAYFLKLRQGAANPAGLRVPRYLVDQGATHVVAPLPTRAEQLWADVDGFTLTLYPFINGATGMKQGLQELAWVAYGAALREIHDTALAPSLAQDVPRDTFTLADLFQRQRQSPWTDVVEAAEACSAQQAVADPSESDLAAFWRGKRGEIQTLVDQFE